MWVCGPYPTGRYPEVVIFRHDLKRNLRQDEKIITDNGYFDTRAGKLSDAPGKEQYHRSMRGRHEGVNGRVKRFKLLTTPFRHDRDHHGLFSRSCKHCACCDKCGRPPLRYTRTHDRLRGRVPAGTQLFVICCALQ